MSAQHVPWATRTTDLFPAPVYLLELDKGGAVTSPKSLEALLEAAASATDVVLFAHGWNNDFRAATSRYDRYFDHLDRVLRSTGAPEREFRPVYVGVTWPSIVLVMPSERGPDIAGGPADDLSAELEALADALEPSQVSELREILADPGPGSTRLERAASILAGLRVDPDDESGDVPEPAEAAALIEAWQEARAGSAPAPTARRGGIIGDDVPVTRPDVAGFNPLELLREGVRLATVRQMKDRAGRVGARGVGPVVRRLVGTGARLHLVGHSYGCRVVLSAVCHGTPPQPKVDSVLLLQPALSALAFAKDVAGRPGGYRGAPDRTRQPIVTTRSAHDMPLTRVFHLALRRRSDLGDAAIAGGPSKFAALGGVGPQGLGRGELVDVVPMPDVGDPYPLQGSHRVVGVDGTRFIPSHGDVECDQTAWALLSQIRHP